jgi:hypothetical protein
LDFLPAARWCRGTWPLIGRRHGRSLKFVNGSVDIETGRVNGRDALVQIAVMPILLALGGTVIAAIWMSVSHWPSGRGGAYPVMRSHRYVRRNQPQWSSPKSETKPWHAHEGEWRIWRPPPVLLFKVGEQARILEGSFPNPLLLRV